jgi:hypothetical protein
VISALCSHIFVLSKINFDELIVVLALEDQTRMAKELEDKRRQVEEAEIRVQQERAETQREHERMMERIIYEQEEKDKIVRETVRIKEKKSP